MVAYGNLTMENGKSTYIASFKVFGFIRVFSDLIGVGVGFGFVFDCLDMVDISWIYARIV